MKLEDFYLAQEKSHGGVLDDKKRKKHSESWFREDTVDYWRHKRIRDVVIPVIECFPKLRWLSVGDGRYGTDAHYLEEKGLTVVASDIADELLKQGKKRGYIKKYAKENAENLSFEDESFDFVYCKEAFHHFPRAMVALGEMMRVARVGVVLQEPKDEYFYETWRHALVHQFGLWWRGVKRVEEVHKFEEVGNYVYSLSPREVEKACLGLGWRMMAYKVIQDSYEAGVEYEEATSESRLFGRLRIKIKKLERWYRLGVLNGGLVTVVLLKDKPNKGVVKALKKAGFKVSELPVNPYV